MNSCRKSMTNQQQNQLMNIWWTSEFPWDNDKKLSNLKNKPVFSRFWKKKKDASHVSFPGCANFTKRTYDVRRNPGTQLELFDFDFGWVGFECIGYTPCRPYTLQWNQLHQIQIQTMFLFKASNVTGKPSSSFRIAPRRRCFRGAWAFHQLAAAPLAPHVLALARCQSEFTKRISRGVPWWQPWSRKNHHWDIVSNYGLYTKYTYWCGKLCLQLIISIFTCEIYT